MAEAKKSEAAKKPPEKQPADDPRLTELAKAEAAAIEEKQKEQAKEIKALEKEDPARAAALKAELEPEPRSKSSPAKKAAARRAAVGDQHRAAAEGEVVEETTAGPMQAEHIQEKAEAQAKVDEEKQELSKETAEKKARWHKRGDLADEAIETPPLASDAVVVPEPTGPSTVVLPAVTARWVSKIKAYLNDQVRQQTGNAQYDAILKELKSEL